MKCPTTGNFTESMLPVIVLKRLFEKNTALTAVEQYIFLTFQIKITLWSFVNVFFT